MAIQTSGLENVREQYLVYGNVQPSYETLTSIHFALNRQAKELGSITMQATLGDISLDLASAAPDTDAADRWLGTAGSHFQQIQDTAAYYKSAESRHIPTPTKQYAAAVTIYAIMKQAELKQWEQAVHGERVQVDYPTVLQAAEQTLPYIGLTTEATGVTRETIPLVLAGRKRRIGRLALERERYGVAGELQNWDVGLAQDTSAEEFLHPSIRLQVKYSRVKQTEAYEDNGIATLRAREDGFFYPERVIKGCLAELPGTDRLPPEDYLNPTILASAELREVTEAITERIRRVPWLSDYKMRG